MLWKQDWTDAIRALHREERIYTYWDYMRKPLAARRACVSITFSSLLIFHSV